MTGDDAEELPEGWATATISELVSKLGSGATPRGGSTAYQATGVPLIRSQNIHFAGFDPDGLVYLDDGQAALLKEVTVQSDDVLLNITGASIGRVCRAPTVMAGARVNQHVCIIRLRGGVLPELLAGYLSSPTVQDMIWTEEYGVTRQALTKGQIEQFVIPVPPLAEQRRIVAAVEALLAAVSSGRARLERVPATLKRFRQSVLAAACSGRLTADWRKAHPGPAVLPSPTESGPEELPDGWVWVRFGTQIRSIRSGSNTPPQNERTDFPILRSSSVRPGTIDLEDVKYLTAQESRNPDNYLTDGDLLFTRLSGSLEFVANCARVSIPTATRIQYPDRLFCAKLVEPKQANYFVLAFGSPVVRNLLTEGAKSSAGHQRVSIGNITKQLVPLPPLAEQAEIVRRVSALFAHADALERRAGAALRRVEGLTQAVLEKAFRGELVPTEAELARREGRTYEPAGDLLARIRAAAPAAPKPRRGRKPTA